MRVFAVFVLFLACAGLSAAELSGTVYLDTNGNGTFDAGDSGMNNVTVQLRQGTTVVYSITTDANGVFNFTGIAAGTYALVESQPNGYYSGVNNVGSAGGSASGDIISGISLAASTVASGYTFGERTTPGSGDDEDEIEDGEDSDFACSARPRAGIVWAAVLFLLALCAVRLRRNAA